MGLCGFPGEGARNRGGAARGDVSAHPLVFAQTLGRIGGSIVQVPQLSWASREVLLPPAGSSEEHRHLVEFAFLPAPQVTCPILVSKVLHLVDTFTFIKTPAANGLIQNGT